MRIASNVRYAEESLRCAAAKPNERMASSSDIAWTSLLLDVQKARGSSAVFETHPTPDVTLVVALSGSHRIEVSKGGHWRSAVYQPGHAGLTAPYDTARLRWSNLPEAGSFETAHLYLPLTLMEETAEAFRRSGRRSDIAALSSLAFRDPVVASAAAALTQGMQAGLPDLYADQAARWLVVHLLARHADWWDPDDARQPEPISDRRLARVLDCISAHLAEPMSLAELGQEAGMSPHHFGRRFRERMGLTPLAYITELRMRQAQRLLRTTDLPVASIAGTCGYTRPAAAFSAAFQRRFGRPPRKMRER